MTQGRAKGKVRPCNHPSPPQAGSKGYIRVIARGCSGGKRADTPNEMGEYYCGDDYGWTCDDCPIVAEKMHDEEAARVAQLVLLPGPPRFFEHPMEFWSYPSVATELHWLYTPGDLDLLLRRSVTHPLKEEDFSLPVGSIFFLV